MRNSLFHRTAHSTYNSLYIQTVQLEYVNTLIILTAQFVTVLFYTLQMYMYVICISV